MQPNNSIFVFALFVLLYLAGCSMPSKSYRVLTADDITVTADDFTVTALGGDADGNVYADAFEAGQIGRTTNQGQTWEVFEVFDSSNTLRPVNDLIVTRTGALLAVAGKSPNNPLSVKVSYDQAKSWSPFSQGLPEGDIYRSDFVQGADDIVYLLIDGRIFFVDDVGSSSGDSSSDDNRWGVLQLPDTSAFAVDVAPAESGVYIATDNGVKVLTQGAWEPVGRSFPEEEVIAFQASESALAIGTRAGNIYAYTEEQETWELVYEDRSGSINPVRAMVQFEDYSFCAGWETGLLVRCFSEALEVSIFNIGSQISPEDVGNPGVRSFYVDSEERLFVGLHAGLVHTEDGGSTWQRTVTHPFEIRR